MMIDNLKSWVPGQIRNLQPSTINRQCKISNLECALPRITPLVAALCLVTASGLFPQTAPTRITIRAVSHDAKIIGDGVGGAMIRVVDAKTGRTLAEGVQTGGTGDTRLIMRTPRARGMSIYDTEGAATFVAELHIDRPTIVNISATGPLGHPQATKTASLQALVVPGQHVMGDGYVLELHGFIVEVLNPEPLTPLEGTLDVRARVEMMCGCPIEPNGLWDANNKTIEARLVAGEKVVSRARLEFAGTTSEFSSVLSVPAAYRDQQLDLEVLAAEAGKGNFGRHVIPVGGAPGAGR